jgi:hypothetical protein
MNSVLTTKAPFYLMAGVPLVGILVNIVLCMSLCRRVDRMTVRLPK